MLNLEFPKIPEFCFVVEQNEREERSVYHIKVQSIDLLPHGSVRVIDTEDQVYPLKECFGTEEEAYKAAKDQIRKDAEDEIGKLVTYKQFE